MSAQLDRIGRIIAPVMINGRGPFRFMLDTGATHTVVAESTLARLELMPAPDTRIAVSGISGSEIAPTVHIDSLDAGDLHFRDLSLPVLAGPVFQGLDGILGMDGFDGMRLSADFLKDRITISRSRGQRPGAAYSIIQVEFLSERLLMVEGHVGRVRVKAIIDTGGTRTIGNRALLVALIERRQNSAQSVQTSVVDATQIWHPGMTGRVPAIRVGESTIGHLDVTFGDFEIFRTWRLQNEPALLIGVDALGTLADLTIDYRRKEVALLPRPVERPPAVAVKEKWNSFADR